MPERVAVVLEPRAVTRQVAADALGLGLSKFEEAVQPQLKVIRVGAKVLVPVAELDRWTRENAEHVLRAAA